MKKEEERKIYLPHVIKMTIPDDGHVQDGGLSAVVVYVMRTHVEPCNVEVLLDSAEFGATKAFRIRGELKRKDRHTRIKGTLN
jgi:hypothetical protein